MSEIFGAVKLKNKIAIASAMAVFAVILIASVGVLNFVTTDTHTHLYDYTLNKAEDGSFYLLGVCNVDNCETPYNVIDDLEGVKLLLAESPTCAKEGKRVYSYSKDGKTLQYTEKVATTPHTYDFEITTQDGVSYVHGSCTVEGCEDKLFASNIEDFKLDSTVPGTCFSARQDTYTYTMNGEERSFVTLVEEYIPHKLNGADVDYFKNADGNYIYGTPGIKSSKTLACGEVADGHYVCEECKQVKAIKVEREGHKFLYDETKVTHPTDSADGLVTLVCHNTECDEVVKITLPKIEVGVNAEVVLEATEQNPLTVSYTFDLQYGYTYAKEIMIGSKLSHNYTYELWLNENTGKFDVRGECHQPGCTAPDVCVEDDVPAVFVEDTSTCLVPGIVIWEYNYKGEILRFEPQSLVPADHVYSYNQEDAEDPTVDMNGLIVLYCITEGCDHEVVVNLPTIVFGENTFFVEEANNGRLLYEYIYETEYNCVVKLDLLIKKEENK